MAFIATAIIGGVGALAGGLISAHGATSAADTQANAANNAAQLQYQSGQDALNFQKQQWATTQANAAPWLNTGRNALGSLGYLLGINPYSPAGTAPATGAISTGAVTPSADGNGGLAIPLGDGGSGFGPGVNNVNTGNPTATTPPTGTAPYVNTSLGGYGSLMTPFGEQFTAPTNVTEQNDPGYQFRLAQGEKALQASAAARGTLFSGGTGKALTRYGQDYASNEYGNVYNRAYNEYANRYNQYENNQTNQFNRLAALSGVGQTTANNLAQIGSNTANNVSSTMMNTANNVGNSYQNAAAARASGYVGGANALGGAISSGTNNIAQLLMLSQMGGMNGMGGGIPSINYGQYVGMGG
jgi:hypothetical protein